MDGGQERGRLFRTVVFVLTSIALASFVVLWIAAILIYGPPPHTYLKELYFNFLHFLIPIFLQMSAVYLLSLIATNLRKHCWNPPSVFITMALLISFHISVVTSGLLALFMPYPSIYIRYLPQICMVNFIIFLIVMSFIYSFSVEFLRISHGEALTSALITGFVFMSVWTFFQFWWLSFRYSGTVLSYMVIVMSSLFAVVAIYFASWYAHRHMEWIERGEYAPPQGFIRTGDLFIMCLSAGLIVGFIGVVFTSMYI